MMAIGESKMGEVLFYHLIKRDVENVLPVLLTRSLQTGSRVVIRTPSALRTKQINAHLWTYSDDSFLPHGMQGDPFPERQPIFITETLECPNNAALCFLIDGVSLEGIVRYKRVFYLFDGRIQEHSMRARVNWKRAIQEGHKVVYCQEKEGGGWERKEN